MSVSSVAVDGTYSPVHLEIDGPPEQQSAFSLLFRGIMSLDLIFYMFGRAIKASFYWIMAFFVLLSSGKYPKDSFDYLTGVLRFNLKVQLYIWGATDQKPTISKDEDPSSPVRLSVVYTEDVGRFRMITNYLMTIVLAIAFIPGLILGAIGVYGGFIVKVFTGNYPEWCYTKAIRMMRWQTNVSVYALGMSTEQPPVEFS
jgi:hypothetical protein